MDHDVCLVISTCPDRNSAERLAKQLVADKLAACVNISTPSLSIYSWEGIVQQEKEVSLQIKTRRSCYKALEKRLLDLHPYDTPEILCLPVETGLQKYLNWVTQSVTHKEK